jgi:photosystem II PsbZ protein
MQILNTLTVLALVVMSFALIVAVPVLYASTEDSGRSNRLILIGGAAWVALVLVNWGMSLAGGLRGRRSIQGPCTEPESLGSASLISACSIC